jgi:hypothetical protein
MLRRLSGPHRAAFLAGATLLLALIAATPALAQLGPSTPPTRVYGSVTINGQPAAGAAVSALIGPLVCGGTSVATDGSYQVDVRSAASQAGCGVDGALVTFTVNDRPARETVTFQSGGFIQQNLTVGAFVAEVSVERWAPYAEEPCAAPSGPWCIRTFPLPPATEPYAYYRMLTSLRDGRETQAVDWILVVPGTPTGPVQARSQRGVERVRWQRWTPAGSVPCAGRLSGGWCIESVDVPPPVTATVWYRILVRRPDGRVEEPAGFIPASP